MTPVLEPLLRSPRLPLYIAELNAVMDQERLARQRFRDELDPSDKGEFINGEVIMHSPARFQHTHVRQLISVLLHAHVERHGLGWVGGEKVLVGLTRNDFEPDIFYYGTAKAAEFHPDQLVFPAPDLVVEILSESTESRDRGVKLEDYALHEVREYWIVDTVRESVEQYELRDGRYSLRAKQTDGTLRSVALPGFSIPIRACFDRALNLQTLLQITQSAS